MCDAGDMSAADLLAALDPDERVVRGGSWSNPWEKCTTSSRSSWQSDDYDQEIGFRLLAIPFG
jgi:formylglycine-generating enzyme required for sulfatase activity